MCLSSCLICVFASQVWACTPTTYKSTLVSREILIHTQTYNLSLNPSFKVWKIWRRAHENAPGFGAGGESVVRYNLYTL